MCKLFPWSQSCCGGDVAVSPHGAGTSPRRDAWPWHRVQAHTPWWTVWSGACMIFRAKRMVRMRLPHQSPRFVTTKKGFWSWVWDRYRMWSIDYWWLEYKRFNVGMASGQMLTGINVISDWCVILLPRSTSSVEIVALGLGWVSQFSELYVQLAV